MSFYFGLFVTSTVIVSSYSENSTVIAYSSVLIGISLTLLISASQSFENDITIDNLSKTISENILRTLYSNSSPELVRKQFTEKAALKVSSKVNSNSIKTAIAKGIVKNIDIDKLRKEIAKEIVKEKTSIDHHNL
ncbi:hypothetical protein BKP35_16455 [Anaerobacillus arseniciselenatis]|uniref:Uncharacterized protein n=1 Tax=Anaerobacillus arseniciselenatis TaxID=85682 RepID=A0A1S2LD53_9BACI|nr:hypothetical protein [Anaerobacillus arseniciselenatis]OIJ09445.1 hypothetical protein BKP35_16455 [Anaerobacillus arseniciselenatis]